MNNPDLTRLKLKMDELMGELAAAVFLVDEPGNYIFLHPGPVISLLPPEIGFTCIIVLIRSFKIVT